MELEEELALLHALLEIGEGSPAAHVPDDDLAGPVVPVRDHALEVGVLDGVVLDLDREALVGGVGGGALRNRPGLQDAGPLQAEIPVQPGGRMFLNDEEMRAVFTAPPEGLGGRVGGPLFPVFFERHSWNRRAHVTFVGP